MKKFILSAVFMMAAWMGTNAMNFERAQAEALYLTDKMAYELNLNDQQYNDAYEINLDYFLRIDSPSDLYGVYYDYRLNDLRCILHDWQYSLLFAADYFLRPIAWRAGGWYFPIYSYYNRNYFYYGRPRVWSSYYGGHSRYYHHGGYYINRRPIWNGGLRGHDMHRPSVGTLHSSHGRGSYRVGSTHRPGANGYHINVGGRGGNRSNPGGVNSGGSRSHSGGVNPGGSRSYSGSVNSGSSRSNSSVMNRGNSFDSSSSRMGVGGGSQRGSVGSSYGGSSRGSSFSGGNRGGGFSGGSTRGGGFSGGSTRGGSFSGGSRGGGGGSSRGGGRR